MIERQDVIRCDHLRIITTGPLTGRGSRCRTTFTAPDGIKIALVKALERGWITLRTTSGHRRHLCPACAKATDQGRNATLINHASEDAQRTTQPTGAHP